MRRSWSSRKSECNREWHSRCQRCARSTPTPAGCNPRVKSQNTQAVCAHSFEPTQPGCQAPWMRRTVEPGSQSKVRGIQRGAEEVPLLRLEIGAHHACHQTHETLLCRSQSAKQSLQPSKPKR